MNTYYISDTHFGHEKIIEFEKEFRPFKSIEEHDEKLIENWNSVVGKRDVVIHLGDVAFKPATILHRVMPRLNGIKKLVIGNHDTASNALYLKYFTKIYSYIEDKKEGIIFSHIPIHQSLLESRWNINVHGHMHSDFVKDRRYINISCEHINLTPVPFEHIKLRINHE